ncbi:GILT-like protein 1 [Chrysoperla carnea]|uniref:GILT-like protein 1 n=1 Tax=Chrysoperla carnea TaxID=189513 RepID=UPI001D069D8D|nr:GILT-like protein 1 [Chrysoperla carnea]
MFKFNLYCILICIFQLILSIENQHQHIPQLQVTVYYESLCPDSVQFIRNQLYPTWKELGQYLQINFIPFGKSSSVNGGQKFVCQHGEKECVGNKLQSCTLNQLEGHNDLQVEFVHCFMTPGPKAKDCASLVGANWDAVKQCHNSNLGIELQLEAEKLTNQIRPQFIPTVVINGVFDQNHQDMAQYNFKGIVCNHIPGAC